MTTPRPTIATTQATAHDDVAVTVVVDQIIVLFQRSRALWRQAAESVHPDLQPVGYRLLRHLVKTGPTNAGQLAGVLDTDRSVVSRQVRVLAGLELLTVEADPLDGRGRVMRATEPACRLVEETHRTMTAQLFGGLGSFEAAEVEALGTMLERLNGAAPPR